MALRVSNHPAVVEICDKFEAAIVSTSANIQGKEPLRTKQEVEKNFDQLSIVEGPLGGLKGSTPIQDVVTERWIRD